MKTINNDEQFVREISLCGSNNDNAMCCKYITIKSSSFSNNEELIEGNNKKKACICSYLSSERSLQLVSRAGSSYSQCRDSPSSPLQSICCLLLVQEI